MRHILLPRFSLVLLQLVLLLFQYATGSTNALFQAVNNDDGDGIGKAITNGADINARGPGLQSPLMAAVLSGKLNAVRELLLRGADPHVPEKDGYTPMHGAGFQVYV